MRAFGSPNLCGSMELCGWGRAYATRFTFGIGNGVGGSTMPDLEHAGCILFWGYNQYDSFGPEGANLNLVISNAAIDPVSGSVPHRAYLCQVRRLE